MTAAEHAEDCIAPGEPTSANLLKRARRWLDRRAGGEVKVSLALQGGGAHGAFTWGVLDRLLEERRLRFVGVSGASAGAVNAAVFASGYLCGGAEGARTALEAFWRDVSRSGGATLQAHPLERLITGWNRDWSPGYLALKAVTRFASPYQLNPIGINPLLPLLERHVDFERLRESKKLSLFVAVTNVHNGQLRIVRNQSLSAKSIAASACLPLLFQAVELDGEHYWDGGYSANPPLTPLVFECDSRDVLVVQLSPVDLGPVPKRTGEIHARTSELSFNAGFLRELQLLAQLRSFGGNSLFGPQRRLQRLNLHRIHGPELSRFGAASRINTEWRFLRHLFEIGRRHGEEWLRTHGDALGRRSTLPFSAFATDQ